MAKDANGKELKVGDKVRRKDGTVFSDGNLVNTIRKCPKDDEHLLGDMPWVANGWIESGKLVKIESSPVREVTKKEIVPGTYGDVRVGAAPKRIYVNVVQEKTKLVEVIKTLQLIHDAME